MNFNILIKNIEYTHSAFFKQTASAVNVNLTLRNWFIGLYIVEFEQNGTERAEYGLKLLFNISKRINIKGLSETNLKLCRKFYKVYPGLFSILPNKLVKNLPLEISQLSTDILLNPEYGLISQSSTDKLKSDNNKHVITLLTQTSFTHFVELIAIEDSLQRKFYELLIINTTPSVKELKRQIELKVDAFKHHNASQLNTYLNFYKKEIKQETDNLPIGILLVADKDNALVEYATAGMDENLFISKYLLQLPDKEKLEAFLTNELRKL